jgi:hypothetical protein
VRTEPSLTAHLSSAERAEHQKLNARLRDFFAKRWRKVSANIVRCWTNT